LRLATLAAESTPRRTADSQAGGDSDRATSGHLQPCTASGAPHFPSQIRAALLAYLLQNLSSERPMKPDRSNYLGVQKR
jgi:hypothetical protein